LYLPLAHDYQRKPGMTGFMKAFTDFKSVKILDGQESYIMRSFAKANAMVVLPAADEKVLAQSAVETILLPI
jgi:molybdopterin molybdotransferase